MRVVQILGDGRLDEEAWVAALGPRTRIAALTHVSNVLGTINPVRRLAAAARAAGARVLLDAAQSVGHLPVRFDDLGVDWLAFSAHKAYGPTGLGFLVGRPDALEQLEPVETGGEMIDEVWETHATWAAIPHRFEAGTPNIAGAAGFLAALDFLDGITPERLRYHEQEITRHALERLTDLGGLRIVGPRDLELRGGGW
ncbi:MAG: aminotransferase class V-fold PLP-dependent enzyme [Pseudomonadota bacterium]